MTDTNEPDIDLTTSGEQAIQDAKDSLSGMDPDGVTRVRIEITRAEDPPELPEPSGDGDTEDSPWHPHHHDATPTVRKGTLAYGALKTVNMMGDATSPEVAANSEFSEKRASTLLSDLFKRGALVRREDEFPYRYKTNEDATITEQ